MFSVVICSCSNSVPDGPPFLEESFFADSVIYERNIKEPTIKSFSFLQHENKKLNYDIPCEIHNDSMIVCFARNFLGNFELIASVNFVGDNIVLSNDERIDSEKRAVNFEKDVVLMVNFGRKRKKYIVKLYPYTGLPYIFIETIDGKEILDEETLRDADIYIVEDPDAPILGKTRSGSVVGHGNSTWKLPKKPYSLKFEKKESLLSFPPSRSWLLLANHYDSTMLRNAIASYISSLSNISYTPRNCYVELVLNGKHKGTYQLFEKIKVSKSRVNIGKEDFLLEVDNHPRDKDVYFSLSNLPRKVKVHSPDVIKGDENYNYIKNTLEKIDNVLFSNNFLDESGGYRDFIDIESVVEWYVVTEITKNASSRANWYMSYEKFGRLKFGPLWDYDLAFGNSLWGTEPNEVPGFWLNTLPWFERFLQDPIFVQKIKERFSFFYSRKNDILKEIDEKSTFLKVSVFYNNRLWNVFNCDSCTKKEVSELYDIHVSKMKDWLDSRFEWLKESMRFEPSPRTLEILRVNPQ